MVDERHCTPEGLAQRISRAHICRHVLVTALAAGDAAVKRIDHGQHSRPGLDRGSDVSNQPHTIGGEIKPGWKQIEWRIGVTLGEPLLPKGLRPSPLSGFTLACDVDDRSALDTSSAVPPAERNV